MDKICLNNFSSFNLFLINFNIIKFIKLSIFCIYFKIMSLNFYDIIEKNK